MPAPRKTIDDLLSEARAALDRLSPQDASLAVERGALLIDIRSSEQRLASGDVPGAVAVERTALEWRVDPASGHQHPALKDAESRKLVVLCAHGYSSSLAAATLCELGFDATDVEGGFEAWAAAGLPVTPTPPLAPR
jgi:rhodanese-related sulfurtransferase